MRSWANQFQAYYGPLTISPPVGVPLTINAPSGSFAANINLSSTAAALNITGIAATQLVALQFQQTGQTQWAIYEPASTSDLRFFAGADRLVLTAAGNVTINAPTSGVPLSVAGPGGTTIINTTAPNATTNTVLSFTQGALAQWFFQNAATTNVMTLVASGGGSTTWAPGGNVTIGVPTSGSALTVNGNGTTPLIVQAGAGNNAQIEFDGNGNTPGGGSGLFIGQTGGGASRILAGGAQSLAIGINGGGQITIGSTGAITITDTTGTVWGSPTGGAQGSGTINATGLFVNGVAVGAGSGTTLVAHKASTTTRTSTTAKTNDPDLALSLTVGTWDVELFLQIIDHTSGTSGGLAGAMAFGGTTTNPSTTPMFIVGTANGAALGQLTANLASGVINVGTVVSSVGATADAVLVKFTLIVSVSGTLNFQWAQASSQASGTDLLAGSYITAIKV
jgi:hypothetical protein